MSETYDIDLGYRWYLGLGIGLGRLAGTWYLLLPFIYVSIRIKKV